MVHYLFYFFEKVNTLIEEHVDGGGIYMAQQDIVSGNNSNSFEECKTGIMQLIQLLPEEKRTAIQYAIDQIEATEGIQDERQGQEILMQLMKGLGL